MDQLLPLPKLPPSDRRAGRGVCRLRGQQGALSPGHASLLQLLIVRRGFCATCGSTLCYEGERWPGEVHLHIGAFDDPSSLAPTGQAFPEERLPWLHLG